MRLRTVVFVGLASTSFALQASDLAPVLAWAYGGCFVSYCQTGWYSSPAVVDVNGDGQAEVVAGSYDVVVLNGASGAVISRASSLSRVWPDIAVADLNSDGHPDLVVARGDGTVTAYAGNLTPISGWPITPYGVEVRALALGDLDGNGNTQIVIAAALASSTGQVDVYTANGTERPGWPRLQAGDPGYAWGVYNDNIALADLRQDGKLEIFVTTDTHFILGLNADGSEIAANAMYGVDKFWPQIAAWVNLADEIAGFGDCGVSTLRGNFASSAPAVGDVNGDGKIELAVVGNIIDCSTFTAVYHLPWLFNGDRSRFVASGADWSVLPAPSSGAAPLPGDNSTYAQPNAVLADLDGDGKEEILYASYDGKVHAYWLDKTEHGAWPFTIPGTGFHFASPPVVADLYHDGKVEVIFTTWPQPDTTETGKLYIVDSLGAVLQSVDLPAPLVPTWNGALASPTLAFLPGSRDISVVLNTHSSGVVAYDLPGTAYGRTLWPTGRGSYRRDGRAFNDRIFADGSGG